MGFQVSVSTEDGQIVWSEIYDESPDPADAVACAAIDIQDKWQS